MHLVRPHLAAKTEMLQHLLPAAKERLFDARAVLKQGSPTGCVYLAGYSVEMVLKHAALRVDGVRLTASPVAAAAASRAHLEREIGQVDHEHYHSLRFWALLLRAAWRLRRGNVPTVVEDAVSKAQKLYQGWMVDLRYRSALIGFADAESFIREAGWFVDRATELARERI